MLHRRKRGSMTDELAWHDATALADLVRRRQVTPLELVDAAIERIEHLNGPLNAVITTRFDKARSEAAAPQLPEGPFRGVPFLLKDLFCHSAGDPYHAGMRLLRERNWIASYDTFLAARYRAAGFIFLGKTNVPELGPMPTTEPEAYGPTHNPWDLSRSPGGSSGGTAAAVASGMVPAAHGNDGGGSIRIPASACGLVGLKPSRGRNSLGPDLAESWSGAVAEHVLTRTVRDSAAILDATAGAMPGDTHIAPVPLRAFTQEVGAAPGHLRIGLLQRVPSNIVHLHPDCLAAVTTAARLLESLGHTVVESHPAALEDSAFSDHFGAVVTSWTRRDLEYWGAQLGRAIGPKDVEVYTWTLAEMGRSVSASSYIASTIWLQRYTRRLLEWWSQGFDLLLSPTMAEPPVRLGVLRSTPDEPLIGFVRAVPLVVFTGPFNVSGQPAISLPLHWSADGLPIGIQLVAPYGREDLLLRVAAQLEEAQPWRTRRPPVG
jgi:amidase